MTQNDNTGRKLAIGALIAGVGGYLAGILTAPKSGKETREDIADKADEIKDDAHEQLQKASDELSDLISSTKSKSLELGSKARSEYNEAVVRAKDAQNKAMHVLKAVKAGEADDPQLNKAIKQAKLAAKNLSRYFKS